MIDKSGGTHADHLLTDHWGLDHDSKEELGLNALLEVFGISVQADATAVAICDPDTHDLVFAAGQHIDNFDRDFRGQALAGGLAKLAVATGETQIGELDLSAFGSMSIGGGEVSGQVPSLLAPMLLDDETVGAFIGFRRSPGGGFTLAQEQLAALVAGLGGLHVYFSRRLGDFRVAAGERQALTEAERQEQAIANRVSTLITRHPHKLKEIEDMLHAIERLL